jgi:hypothetical protein
MALVYAAIFVFATLPGQNVVQFFSFVFPIYDECGTISICTRKIVTTIHG